MAAAVTAREPDWGAMAVNRDQRGALQVLVGSPLGATEAMMLAHGFRAEMLARLVRDDVAGEHPRWRAVDEGDMAEDHRCGGRALAG
jgi:hypothetical protein